MRLPAAVHAYVISLLGLALAGGYLTFTQISPDSSLELFLTPFVLFVAISFLVQIYEIELVYRGNIAITHPIFIATLLLGGIPLALAVMAASTLIAEIILRWPIIRGTSLGRFIAATTFNVGQIALSTFAGAVVFERLGGSHILPGGHVTGSADPATLIFAAIAAFMTYTFTSSALVGGIISLTEKTSFVYYLRFSLGNLMVQILSLGALGILLAEVYSYSPWNLLLVLIPMGLVHASLRSNMKLRHEAQKTFENTAKMLAERDPYTYEHSEGVERLAADIAKTLNMSQDEIEEVKSAALIHDIGKLAVPDRILLKPGPLTPEERKEMEKHPVIGAELLKNLEIYRKIVAVVRHEHERWDGQGYPDRLAGNKIPLGARIIAAADIYNALTTDRPYRKAYSHSQAINLIREMSGSHLDPAVVDALLRVFGELETQPQPILRRAWQTALPFSPILLLIAIFITKLL